MIWPNQSLSLLFMHLQGNLSFIGALLDPFPPLASAKFLQNSRKDAIGQKAPIMCSSRSKGKIMQTFKIYTWFQTSTKTMA